MYRSKEISRNRALAIDSPESYSIHNHQRLENTVPHGSASPSHAHGAWRTGGSPAEPNVERRLYWRHGENWTIRRPHVFPMPASCIQPIRRISRQFEGINCIRCYRWRAAELVSASPAISGSCCGRRAESEEVSCGVRVWWPQPGPDSRSVGRLQDLKTSTAASWAWAGLA